MPPRHRGPAWAEGEVRPPIVGIVSVGSVTKTPRAPRGLDARVLRGSPGYFRLYETISQSVLFVLLEVNLITLFTSGAYHTVLSQRVP
jgi:hypothetical protein